MLRAFIRWPDGRLTRESDVATLHRALYTKDTILWLDMQKPAEHEFELLAEVFNFHPLAIEDSMQYAQRPKVENYAKTDTSCPFSYFYMVFHGPDLKTFKENLRTKELDMFVSERFLVTIHEEAFLSINEIVARGEHDPHFLLDNGIDVLLYHILDKITDHYQPILDYLQEALDELEDDAVAKPTPELLGRISAKKRELLNLRRIVGPQREVVAQLTRGEVPFIRESTRIYFRDIQDHLIRVVEMVELYRDLVLGARDIYLSSISNNLNRVMKALTIITVTALPATIITSFFGQNFQVPVFEAVLHSNAGFWISMGLMVMVMLALLLVFRRFRWL
jgi:magnesium transporter